MEKNIFQIDKVFLQAPQLAVEKKKKFYAGIPKNATYLLNCALRQDKETILAWATQEVEENPDAVIYIMECIAIVETEKTPVIVKEL